MQNKKKSDLLPLNVYPFTFNTWSNFIHNHWHFFKSPFVIYFISFNAALDFSWLVPSTGQFLCKNFHTTVDLKKLRLSTDDSGIGHSEPLSSPEWDEFPFTNSDGMIHGFCCATFPLAKGFTKAVKRLWENFVIWTVFLPEMWKDYENFLPQYCLFVCCQMQTDVLFSELLRRS